jgi:hypothetical protein
MKTKLTHSARTAFTGCKPAIIRWRLFTVAGLLALVEFNFSHNCPAQQPQPANDRTFPSSEEASRALFNAVQSHDDQAIMQILHGEKGLVSLGDAEAEKFERENFVQKYQEMHRLVREPDGATVLYIGAENWPLPIPLVSKKGHWTFDCKAGKKEVLFRQIGSNELTAIAICHELIAVGKGDKPTLDEAVSDYMKHVVKTDAENKSDAAADGGSEKSTPFHGYYFRDLTGRKSSEAQGTTGEVAFLAYPAEYRSSGVMTFIVNQDGVVYEKDLGPNNAKLVTAMVSYKKDSTWRASENQEVSEP